MTQVFICHEKRWRIDPYCKSDPQCCCSLKLIYRQNLDLISIFLNYSFLIHRDNDQIGTFEFSRTFYDAIYLPLECSFGRGHNILV